MILNSKRVKQLKKKGKFRRGKTGFRVDRKERAIINVGAERYDDIFSPYCYKGGDTLKMELVDYIEEKAETVPLDYDLKIVFHIKDSDEEKRKDIERAIRENYENDIRAINTQMKRTNVFSLYLLILGAVFLTSFILTYDIVPMALNVILELLSWVFIWESLDTFFLDRRLHQLNKIKKYRLFTAKIETVEFEQY